MPLRITVTVKGELEDYVRSEMDRLDEAAGTICKILCQQGMEYRQGLKSMAVLAAAVEQQQSVFLSDVSRLKNQENELSGSK